MAVESVIKINFVGDTKSLQRSMRNVDRSVTGFSGKIKTSGTSLVKTFAAAAGGAALFTKGLDFVSSSLREAANEQKSIAALARILKNAGIPREARASTEEWITSLQNATGILDDELRPALAKLVSSGVPLAKSQKLLAAALDISVAKGKPLQTVVTALAKGYQGQTSALGRLGIATKDASGKALTFDQIMKNANRTMGGAAQAAADTAGGKLAILQAKFQDMKEQVGAALLPVMSKLLDFLVDDLVPAFQAAAEWIGRNKAVLIPFAVALGTVTVALKLAAAATAIFNAALATNPIVLFALAIAALVAGVVVAYQKVEWFRNLINFFGRTFRFLGGVIKTVWDTSIYPVFAAFGAFAATLGLAFDSAVRVIGRVFEWLGDKIDAVWRAVIKPIYDKVKWLLDHADDIPGVGGGGGFGNIGGQIGNYIAGGGRIPGMATGGIVTKPTLAMIGEAVPEAVIPLSGGLRGGMGGEVHVTFNVYDATDPDRVVRSIDQYVARNGGRKLRAWAAAS